MGRHSADHWVRFRFNRDLQCDCVDIESPETIENLKNQSTTEMATWETLIGIDRDQ